ncbi:restriction endonuclease [Paenibacillus anseongense]|uniref:nSTAND3 domain-containing NTPase n=1 Tax=Paenibacillus anseongense TaxID=2682845 RepID=UPI002DB91FAA|nr:restriction endonuclease [Paenibacillus anseongense]MEC0270123.1 restriction endonuclease [Paenibacillus anseongense]
MPDYDFTSLSSYDFELLARDLLQKELKNKTFESFKSGRDGGIDLRYSVNKGNAIIVQCKHYAKSTFSNLKAEIRKELPKIKKLKVKRYILVTSFGLTPSNKEEIIELLDPYIISTGDIFGKEDINNLLGKYPDVERSNFKLWLTSVTVMERIIHSDVYNKSDIELDLIKQKIKFYVQNKNYFQAKQILSEANYCIIAGAPGIGKTTLAEIILVDYLAHEYEVFKVSSIDEAYKLYNPEKKQIFYYDDFLGQTSLDRKLNNNEDEDIIKFIKSVRKAEYTKFILTTREYILNQAKIIYEKLATSNFDEKKCIIQLSDYTLFNKAEILYNHLHFSETPALNKKKLLENKNYLKIINHKNYSPRIIEWMTVMNNNEDQNYFNSFMNHLDNPQRLWQHAFEFQISEVAQRILIVMSTLSPNVLLEDLQLALDSYDSHRKTVSSSTDFRKALRQLEGNFIRVFKVDYETILSFSNPSIRDFIENYLAENLQELRPLCESLYFFDQCITLWNNAACNAVLKKNLSNQFINSLVKLFEAKTFTLFNFGTRNYNVSKVASTLESRFIAILDILIEINYKSSKDGIISIEKILYNKVITDGIRSRENYPVLIDKLIKLGFQYGVNKDEWINAIKNNMMEYLEDFDTYEIFSDLENAIPDFINSDEKNYIQQNFKEIIQHEQEHYLEDEKDVDVITGYYVSLERIAAFLDVDMSEEFTSLDVRIKNIQEEIDHEPDYGDDDDNWRDYNGHDDSDIDSLFDSLM